MDREQWTKVSLEIADHIKAIQTIVKRNRMDWVGISVFSDKLSWATHIDDTTETNWGVKIKPDGSTELDEKGLPYYTRT